MRFFQDARYPFIRYRRAGYLLSAGLLALSIAAIAVRGIQYGIDFEGGRELIVVTERPLPLQELRAVLQVAVGPELQVRAYGRPEEFQVRAEAESDAGQLETQVVQALAAAFPGNTAEVTGSNLIGPVFANDIRQSARVATLFAILVIGIYILIRFKEISYMASVILTLLHDTVIILGLFTLLNGVLPFDMDINQSLVAALLTVIGYSLNDTIVVFDRVRENRRLHPHLQLADQVNSGINQTLSRTVVTSLTTLFVVAVLFLFGGAVLKGFSFALILGVVLGTYSTLFVSCPLVVELERLFRRRHAGISAAGASKGLAG